MLSDNDLRQRLEALEGEVTRLQDELKQKCEDNATLLHEIDMMRQQEASMSALFRGARPTVDGQRAHARMHA